MKQRIYCTLLCIMAMASIQCLISIELAARTASNSGNECWTSKWTETGAIACACWGTYSGSTLQCTWCNKNDGGPVRCNSNANCSYGVADCGASNLSISYW